MSLQALLAEVDPSWFASGGVALDQRLLAPARRSRLGRRLLARILFENGAGGALLAPRPGASTPTAVIRWPRAKLARLVRDLGVLAYAPVIRAEVRRDPVRRLKRALGGSYLLPLDPTIWDAKVEPEVLRRLQAQWEPMLGAAQAQDDDALLALFDRQGRGELRRWAGRRDAPLGEWAALLHPREEAAPGHLPEKPVLLLATHHETRRESP